MGKTNFMFSVEPRIRVEFLATSNFIQFRSYEDDYTFMRVQNWKEFYQLEVRVVKFVDGIYSFKGGKFYK